MNPTFPRRRKLRLAGYDYASEGLYFVTICSHRKIPVFGIIADDIVLLTDAGKIVDEIWSQMFQWIEEPRTWIIMPNHIHGVVAITEESAAMKKPLGLMIAAFKAISAKRINRLRGTPGAVVWKRDFYERIVRNERALEDILTYIADNPRRWGQDPENPGIRIRTKAI